MRVLFLLMLTVSTAWGQQRALPSVPQQLSLDEAVELAVRFNPAYRQFVNDRTPARWNLRAAYGGFLPAFTVNGGVGYSGSGSQAFAAQEFVQPSGTVSSNYGI